MGSRKWGAMSVGRWSGRAAHLGSCGRGMLVLMPALGFRLPRGRGGGRGEGATGAVFPVGARASRLKGLDG
jgi:hypothetical protein